MFPSLFTASQISVKAKYYGKSLRGVNILIFLYHVTFVTDKNHLCVVPGIGFDLGAPEMVKW
jgi:hypothetical protein